MTAEFWGEDLSGALFRDVDLTDATITHAWMVNVQVDALVDGLVINGVDVTDYVNERDPWYPLRTMLRPADPEAMRATWAALESEWATTLQHVATLPAGVEHVQVDGEFSFVETLRHLLFAVDKWCTSPVLGEPLHPFGLPNRGSLDFPWPGLHYELHPSLAEVLAVRADRNDRVRALIASIDDEQLRRSVDVLENGPHTVHNCLFTVFEEEFWHLRYARRDLATIEAGAR